MIIDSFKEKDTIAVFWLADVFARYKLIHNEYRQSFMQSFMPINTDKVYQKYVFIFVKDKEKFEQKPLSHYLS